MKSISFTFGVRGLYRWLYGYHAVPVQGLSDAERQELTSLSHAFQYTVSLPRYVFWIGNVTATEWAMLLLRWGAVERP
jgi:hypothetical protein